MKSTLHRIKEFIEWKNISVRAFETSIGFSNDSFRAQLKNNKTIGIDKVEEILHVYEEINPTWLITGKGKMLLNSTPPINYNILGEFLETSNTNEELTEIVRFLHGRNDVLMKSPIFRQYIKSNIDLLGIEEQEKNLEEKKKKIKETIIDKLRMN